MNYYLTLYTKGTLYVKHELRLDFYEFLYVEHRVVIVCSI